MKIEEFLELVPKHLQLGVFRTAFGQHSVLLERLNPYRPGQCYWTITYEAATLEECLHEVYEQYKSNERGMRNVRRSDAGEILQPQEGIVPRYLN